MTSGGGWFTVAAMTNGIPARIAAAKAAAGLTDDDIAVLVGVDRKTVARWQTHHGASIKANHLTAVAAILDVDPTWLLVGELPETAR